MSDFSFTREDALMAIDIVQKNSIDWLYENYPKPGGQSRRSTTGFLVYDGIPYPVKPLGRLACEISGDPMTANPVTDVFRRHFQSLEFTLTDKSEKEAEEALVRHKRLIEQWLRPRQAKFRKAVFGLYGSKCIVSGCETVEALEAAHVLPVASGGGDAAVNGLPLRADLHQLFDAGLLSIDPKNWTVVLTGTARKDYSEFQGVSIAECVATAASAKELAAALQKRNA